MQNGIRVNYSIGDLFYGEVSAQDLQLSGMIYVHLEDEPAALGDELNQKIFAYPNPCRSFLFIQTELTMPLMVRITGLNGVVLKHERLLGNQAVDLSDLVNGVYILQVSDLEYTFYFVEKFIKAN
jgi:hypothetical protein